MYTTFHMLGLLANSTKIGSYLRQGEKCAEFQQIG